MLQYERNVNIMKLKKILALVSATVLTGSAVLLTPSSEEAVRAETGGYSIKLDESSSWSSIYENGVSKTWNVAERIESASESEDFVISSNLRDYEIKGYFSSYHAGNDERENHLFVLESDSVLSGASKNIIVSDGIYEIRQDAFSYSDGLESLTLGDSVVRFDEQHLPADIVIRGHAGSLAENYASVKSLAFEYTGDINNDGEINSADILKMASVMNGKTEFEGSERLRADENMDGAVNIVDYVMMKNEITEPRNSSVGASVAGAIAAPELKNLKRNTAAPKSDGFTDFASESASEILLNTVDQNGAENTVYSPLSVYMALSIAAECADGNTRDEMLSVLHAKDMKDLQQQNSSLFESLYFDKYNTYCKIANSVWLNKKWSLEEDTLKTIADKYYAVSFDRDFSDPAVPDEISEWIYKNTSGKFKPAILFNDPKAEILRIINTVTFKEKWQSEFGKPSPGDFYLSDGSELKCDFLYRSITTSKVNIGFADNFMKYAVQMNDNYRMNFILPDQDVSINDIVSDTSSMSDIYNDNLEYQQRGIIFAVPVFDVSSKFSLIDASSRLGINDAFDKLKGNFTNIIDYGENNIEGAYISEITHEATVKIDEKGCEAAAYTIIGMSAVGCMPPESEEPVVFVLDRPFFWYISDDNGTPLFSGIINNPLEK